MADEKTYEMLWDCKYCGANKLLGLTHRFCPSCGAPQDQQARYFPNDADKVAVEDHQYVGADRLCPACSEANSAKSNNCRHCGSPLDGSKAAATRADQLHDIGAYAGDSAKVARDELIHGRGPAAPVPAPPAPPKRSLLGWLLGCGCLSLLVGGIVLVAVILFWTREAKLEVTGHTWERTVEIEAYGEVTETGWCDELPSGAKVTSRQQAKRGTEKVADGEDCKTRKKDQGDGTFKEIKECTPKFKDQAVMSDQCTYRISKWRTVRTARAEGRSLKDTPKWPELGLSRQGTCDGCERGGKQTEKFVVKLKEAGSGTPHECTLPQADWARLAVGSRHKGAVSKVTGGLNCATLAPAK